MLVRSLCLQAFYYLLVSDYQMELGVQDMIGDQRSFAVALVQ